MAVIDPVFLHSCRASVPGCAAGVAALLALDDRWRGALVATLLCGGNVATADARDWLLR